MGRSIALLLERAGHDVVLGARTPHPSPADAALAPTASFARAIEHAGLVVLAVPHAAIDAVVDAHAHDIGESIVIDIANAVAVVDGHLRSGLASRTGDGSRASCLMRASRGRSHMCSTNCS